MSSPTGVGERIDAAVARYADAPLPEPRGLPRWAAPLPEWLENVGLRLAWPVVAINLVGTAFGFWYYGAQLAAAPPPAWPLIPVSPLATLYLALSLAAWRLGFAGRLAALLHVLAFFGCVKYGAWTVVVQLFVQGPGYVHPAMWQFLVWSHAAMVLQAFLIQRYADFPAWAVAGATAWFVLNDVVDYFVSVLGGPHHTWVTVLWNDGGIDRTLPAFEQMAAAAVVLTVLTTALAVGTWYAIARRRDGERG